MFLFFSISWQSWRKSVIPSCSGPVSYTHLFDVKATRNNDYYLTITESKKKFDKDGVSSYEKHKIFLYKEDFEKFAEGLEDAVAVVKSALEGKLPETN